MIYEPALHEVHAATDVAPRKLLSVYFPAGHATHVAAELEPYCPLGQKKHKLAPIKPLYFPGAQVVHISGELAEMMLL